MQELVALYRLTVPATNLEHNIAPTTMIDSVIAHDEAKHHQLVRMRWGLIPSWWKKPAKEAPSTFNARAETVAEKPMFRTSFKRRRSLIPASGYYEWKPTPEGKQPYYITGKIGRCCPLLGCEAWLSNPRGATPHPHSVGIAILEGSCQSWTAS